MSDLKTLAEETRYKIVMHGAETYEVTERVKRRNEETILEALQKAYEMGRQSNGPTFIVPDGTATPPLGHIGFVNDPDCGPVGDGCGILTIKNGDSLTFGKNVGYDPYPQQIEPYKVEDVNADLKNRIYELEKMVDFYRNIAEKSPPLK